MNVNSKSSVIVQSMGIFSGTQCCKDANALQAQLEWFTTKWKLKTALPLDMDIQISYICLGNGISVLDMKPYWAHFSFSVRPFLTINVFLVY